MKSCIFTGTIRHRRFVVKPHQFEYKLFMMYLNLAELETVFEDYWLWSSKGFNVAAFKRDKYFGDLEQPLIDSVRSRLSEISTVEHDHIGLLTNLAYYGYCFNPISLYFCSKDNQLLHCINEVTNTPWQEQQVYLLEPETADNKIFQTRFQKQMHVSPFLTMDYEYRMRCKYTPEHISVQLENWQNEERHFDATLNLTAQPINSKNLAKVLMKFPFMTAKVFAAIHWQALKLWLKGVPVIDHPNNK